MKTKLTTIKIITITVLFGMLLAFTGCSTIVRGSRTDVYVDSSPVGAKVVTSNGQTGVTPVTFTLKRKDNYIFTVSKDGYITEKVEVTSVLSGQGIGTSGFNIIAGGVVGLVIDASSGTWYDLEPNRLSVILQPIESTPPVDTGPPTVVAVQ